MKPRAALVAPLLAILALTTASAVLSSPATAAAKRFASAGGVTVVTQSHPSARLWQLTVSTHQLQRQVRVNVLLPVGYAATSRRYPVLYLLHGRNGGANDWLSAGHAEAASRHAKMIIVMPDGGYKNIGGSFYANWLDQHTRLGHANWSRFHNQQLIPFVDANLRTVRGRAGRAIAGLSMGGFGATSYAAIHPDEYVSAASFSGVPDLATGSSIEREATSTVTKTAQLDDVQPNAIFGVHRSNEINWKGHDPATLVRNMRPVDIELWSGNGKPGPYDASNAGQSSLEQFVHRSTVGFANAAHAAGVRYYFDNYGNGTHSWPYWARDLREYLPRLTRVFAAPRARPREIYYRCIDKAWTEWGWVVANHRAGAKGWSSLARAGVHGFVLQTAQSALVTTPRYYVPGSVHTISVSGGRGPATATTGSDGRLRLGVSTGAGTAAVTIH